MCTLYAQGWSCKATNSSLVRNPGVDGCVIALLAPFLVLATRFSAWWGWVAPLFLVVAFLLGRKVGREGYDRVAETFGVLPSRNVRDNRRQATFILVVSGALCGLGYLFDLESARVALLTGLCASFLISGLRLMREWNERHR